MKTFARTAFWFLFGAACAVVAILLVGPERLAARPKATADAHGHEGETGEGGHEGHEGHEDHEVELSPEAIAAAEISTVKAELRAMKLPIRATGAVALDEDHVVHISPRIRGRVERIEVRLGQLVKKGVVLAILDSVDLGLARAGYLKAKAGLESAEVNYRREERLMNQGATTEPEFLEAKTAWLMAEAELRVARETLLLYGLARQEVDALTWEHEAPIGFFPIAAPLEGTVIEKHLTVGEVVDTSERLLTIADLSNVWVLLDVYPRDVPRLVVGQPVECEVEGLREPVQGSLTYIPDVVRTETRTIQVRAEVANRERRIKPGAFVNASIHKSIDPSASRTVVIPHEAVQTMEGRSVVFVKEPEEPNRFRRVEVTLGRRIGGWQEVLAGLAEGQEVVASGSFVLKSELQRGQMEHQH